MHYAPLTVCLLACLCNSLAHAASINTNPPPGNFALPADALPHLERLASFESSESEFLKSTPTYLKNNAYYMTERKRLACEQMYNNVTKQFDSLTQEHKQKAGATATPPPSVVRVITGVINRTRTRCDALFDEHDKVFKKFVEDASIAHKDVSLSEEQLESFVARGFLKLENVVSQDVVNKALRQINYFIGTGEHTGHTLHANLHIPELDFSNEIMSLLTANPILKHAAQMIGGMKQLPYSTGVRATVRFPGFNYKYPREQVTWEEISMENRDHFYHVDGIGWRKGELRSMSLVVGVYLSDSATSNALRVLPGSHYILNNYIKQKGMDDMLQNDFPKNELNMTAGEMVHTKPGDIVIMHHMLAHECMPNVGFNARYAVYFRLYTDDFPDYWNLPASKARFVDMWQDFRGISKNPNFKQWTEQGRLFARERYPVQPFEKRISGATATATVI